MRRITCFAAVATLLSATAVAQAQSTPLRDDILAQCPALGEQLPELLASTKQQVDRQGSVQMELRVSPQGQLSVERLDGTRAYLLATRQAVQALQCPTAAAERYSLTVRFADDTPPKAATVRQLAAL